MEIYICLLFIVLLHLALKTNKTISIVFLLVLVASIRSLSVGVDTSNYLMNYEYEIKTETVSELLKKTEIGWLYINLLVKEYFGEFRVILIISSLLTILPINYVFKKGTRLPVLAYMFYILLFYYFFSYSILRQAIATSFFVLSIHFFVERKNVKALIAIGIGILIHYSILALLPIVWGLNKIKISYNKCNLVLIGAFFIGFSGVLDLMRSYMSLLPFEKYANYEFYNDGADFNRLANYLFVLPKILVFFYIIRCIKKYQLNIKDIHLKLFWFGLVILVLFLSIPQVSRFTFYLTIFEVIIMVNVISLLPNRKKPESIIVFLIYCLMYFVYYSMTNRFGVIPFEFY